MVDHIGKTAKLNLVATALKLHPRSVLRRVKGRENPYWTPRYNCVLDLCEVSRACNVDLEILQKAIVTRGECLLTQAEAAELLNIHPRTFRWRKYEPIVAFGKTRRYYRPTISEIAVNEALM